MNTLPALRLVNQVAPLPAEMEAAGLQFARALARAMAAEHHKQIEQAAAEKPPASR
jgi:hypothetical protein